MAREATSQQPDFNPLTAQDVKDILGEEVPGNKFRQIQVIQPKLLAHQINRMLHHHYDLSDPERTQEMRDMAYARAVTSLREAMTVEKGYSEEMVRQYNSILDRSIALAEQRTSASRRLAQPLLEQEAPQKTQEVKDKQSVYETDRTAQQSAQGNAPNALFTVERSGGVMGKNGGVIAGKSNIVVEGGKLSEAAESRILVELWPITKNFDLKWSTRTGPDGKSQQRVLEGVEQSQFEAAHHAYEVDYAKLQSRAESQTQSARIEGPYTAAPAIKEKQLRTPDWAGSYKDRPNWARNFSEITWAGFQKAMKETARERQESDVKTSDRTRDTSQSQQREQQPLSFIVSMYEKAKGIFSATNAVGITKDTHAALNAAYHAVKAQKQAALSPSDRERAALNPTSPSSVPAQNKTRTQESAAWR